MTYPIGLLQKDEAQNLRTILLKTGANYWTLSSSYYNDMAFLHSIQGTGEYTSSTTDSVLGIRPVISLNSNTDITSGDGSESNPWIVE